MFGLKCELQVDDVGAFEIDHDVALVADDALLSAFEKSLLLHQLQRVEHSRGFEPGEEHARETASADALDDLEVGEPDLVALLLLPDGLDFQQLVAEYADGLASLEVVVLQDVPAAGGLPVADAPRREIGIVCLGQALLRT